MRDQRRDPWLTSPSSAPRRRPRRTRARPTRRRSAPAASSSCPASSPSGPATRSSPAARSRSRRSRSSPTSRAILAEAGTGLDRLVKTTVFLQNLDDFQGMNSVYAKHVGEQPPARSTVEVAELPSGALVEIEAMRSYSSERCAFLAPERTPRAGERGLRRAPCCRALPGGRNRSGVACGRRCAAPARWFGLRVRPPAARLTLRPLRTCASRENGSCGKS